MLSVRPFAPPPSPDDVATVAQREAEPRRGRDGPRRRGSRGWGERGAVLRPHAETRGGILLAGQDPGGLLHHQQGGATRVEAVPSLGRGRVGQGGSGGEGVVVLFVCLPRRLFGRRGMRDGAERDSRIRSVGGNPKKVTGVCCCRQEIQGRSSGLFSSTTANFHKREPPGPHQRPTSRNTVLPRCLMPALLGNPCC